MSAPKIDMSKLKAVVDWSQDLSDELTLTEDLLPCNNSDRGGCVSLPKNRAKLPEEINPKNLCTRCQARWHSYMAAKRIHDVYEAKTSLPVNTAPNFS